MDGADSAVDAREPSHPDAFPSDAALPQLPAAVDPRLMRDLFARHLPALGLVGTRVDDCRVDRLRYRRGERCVVQYALGLREPLTGLSRQRWVSGGLYASARARRVWEKAGGARATFLPELDMVIQVYPHDRKLPSLPQLATAPPPELGTALLRDLGPGPWEPPQWTIEPVRYRAELGATLRYVVRAREAGSGRLHSRCSFVKVYAGEDAAVRSHAALRALRERASSPGAGPWVPRPIAFLPGLHALALEEVGGVSFGEVLAHGEDPEGAARRVARALASLHLDGPALPRRRTRDDDVAALARAVRLIGWVCPELDEEVAALARAIAAGLEEEPRALAHNDLKVDHVILDGERVGLVDLDSAAVGNPLLDLGTLLADLTYLRLREGLPADRARGTGRALVDAYFGVAPARWRAQLPPACASAALDKALHFFRRQEPGWRDGIRTMVREAREALAGRGPW